MKSEALKFKHQSKTFHFNLDRLTDQIRESTIHATVINTYNCRYKITNSTNYAELYEISF